MGTLWRTGCNNGCCTSKQHLHIHDFAYDYQPTAWATGTADAEGDGAIVQNNSWGFDEQYGAADLDVVLAYKSNNGLTGGATLVYYQGVDTDGDGIL